MGQALQEVPGHGRPGLGRTGTQAEGTDHPTLAQDLSHLGQPGLVLAFDALGEARSKSLCERPAVLTAGTGLRRHDHRTQVAQVEVGQT